MKSTEIFNFMRPSGLTDDQVKALYLLLEQGAKIETIAQFIGMVKPTEGVSPKPSEIESPTKPKFSFSNTSLTRLQTCHPDIQKVIHRAMEITTMDFMVLEGERTKEQAYINWGKGRTAAQLSAKGVPVKYSQPSLSKVTWLSDPLNSKHIKQKDGYAHAIDLCPYPISWEDIPAFQKLGKIIKQAAKDVGVKIEWGGDWSKPDYPHVQI